MITLIYCLGDRVFFLSVEDLSLIPTLRSNSTDLTLKYIFLINYYNKGMWMSLKNYRTNNISYILNGQVSFSNSY